MLKGCTELCWENCKSDSTVQWLTKFCTGVENLDNDKRGSLPATIYNDEMNLTFKILSFN